MSDNCRHGVKWHVRDGVIQVLHKNYFSYHSARTVAVGVHMTRTVHVMRHWPKLRNNTTWWSAVQSRYCIGLTMFIVKYCKLAFTYTHKNQESESSVPWGRGGWRPCRSTRCWCRCCRRCESEWPTACDCRPAPSSRCPSREWEGPRRTSAIQSLEQNRISFPEPFTLRWRSN